MTLVQLRKRRIVFGTGEVYDCSGCRLVAVLSSSEQEEHIGRCLHGHQVQEKKLGYYITQRQLGVNLQPREIRNPFANTFYLDGRIDTINRHQGRLRQCMVAGRKEPAACPQMPGQPRRHSDELPTRTKSRGSIGRRVSNSRRSENLRFLKCELRDLGMYVEDVILMFSGQMGLMLEADVNQALTYVKD
ncbi:hypothetical protein EVAR_79826_1 [Eumeta japonica]|uniref:Uncharacterized protein n=1 Tax=Eumeta variegata TaxID=151549 RepID=A0A4C1WTF7_EUMVA|nr:hypothetical protein EVAR_79826_1 [Eumeta japonica]